MAQLTIERDTLPEKQARYWLEGNVVIVQLGRDLTDLEARRIIREARRKYGIGRRFLPIPLGPPRLRDTARNHPIPTAAVATVVAGALAAGAFAGLTLPAEDPNQRRQPPAAAGPAPSPGPPTSAPPRPSPTAPSAAGPSSSPGHQDGLAPPRRSITPAESRPAPVRPSTPPTGAEAEPPTTSPPTSPPDEPPPGRRCLVDLRLQPLLRVGVLCSPR